MPMLVSLRAFAFLVVLQSRHVSHTCCLENPVNEKHNVFLVMLQGRHLPNIVRDGYNVSAYGVLWICVFAPLDQVCNSAAPG